MTHAENILLTCCLLLCACGEYQVESEEKKTESEAPDEYILQLSLQSEDNAKINFPLSAFLFDDKNNCIRQENIPDGGTDFSLTLPEGRYKLTVLSGLSGNDCSYPLEIIPESYISLNGNNYCKLPFQMGEVSVNLSQSTQANVTLSYVVASVSFSLSGIPSDADAVEVGLSPVSSGITFGGHYRNDGQQSLIPCRKEGYRWTSEPVYIFPEESSQTHLSINVQSPGGNEAYGYTYPSALKAGYPYRFTGNYKDGISLDGNFQVEGWKPAVDIEFGFEEVVPDDEDHPGPGDDEEDDFPSDPDADVFIVAELPEADNIWGDFYVWQTRKLSSAEQEAVIIAPDQWYTLAADAQDILSGYESDGVEGWRTFTTEEAEAFRDQFRNSVSDLNDFLLSEGLDRFYYNEGARYLCNNLKSTFSLTNNRIIDAGKTVEYYLRPIKTVRMKLKR